MFIHMMQRLCQSWCVGLVVFTTGSLLMLILSDLVDPLRSWQPEDSSGFRAQRYPPADDRYQLPYANNRVRNPRLVGQYSALVQVALVDGSIKEIRQIYDSKDPALRLLGDSPPLSPPGDDDEDVFKKFEQAGETVQKETVGGQNGYPGRDEENLAAHHSKEMPTRVQCSKEKGRRKQNIGLDCSKRLPHVIGIGVEKCGTGALTFFLRMHPHVAHSSPKELYYWNKEASKSLDWYRNKMPTSSKYQVTMEYTPSYIFGRDIPYLIRERAPDTRFIVIIRDPVERAVSHYLHVQHYNWDGVDQYKPLVPGTPAEPFISSTFERSVVDDDGNILEGNAIVENGLYDIHLQRWFDVFPKSHFLILDGDELSNDPIPILRQIETFMGIPPYFNQKMIYLNEERGIFCKAKPVEKCLSDTKGRTHPMVREDVVQKLIDYYRPHNARLNSLMQRQFSWTD